MTPRVDIKDISHKLTFDNAEAFADQIILDGHHRTFAYVSGNFIFGDIIEALWSRRGVGIKKLYIMSLSMSMENILSIYNIISFCPYLEKIVIVLSGYWYSHEKYQLVPFLYEKLDDGSNRLQVAFGGYHGKVVAIETALGHYIVMHGSANLRSSNSVEQVMVEEDRELFEFNARVMDEIAERFGTINYKVPKERFRRIEGERAYNVIREAVKNGEW